MVFSYVCLTTYPDTFNRKPTTGVSTTMIESRIFTADEKKFVKQQLANVSKILRKWESRIKDKNIAEIKTAFLTGQILTDDSDWLIDQNIIKSFQNKTAPELGEPVEIAILRSFVGMCKKTARKASQRVAIQTGLSVEDAYEDLLQESMKIVLHSMYYYCKEEVELSTFIGDSLKNGINRSIRYHHCVTSPISVEDNTTKTQLFELIKNHPGFSFDQIVDLMKEKHGLKSSDRIHELLRTLTRESENEDQSKSRSLNNIPCKNSDQEEIECLDTVGFLEKILSPESQKILNLSNREIDILKFGIQSNFERGWQIRYSERVVEGEKPITRQRVGQIYESVVKKIRPVLTKACG